MSMRKAVSRPASTTHGEDIERRLAMLEDRVRRMPARITTPAATSTTSMLKQTTHGLAVGNVIRHDGSNWVKSKADTAANAVVGGIVIAVLSPDVFVLATAGYVAGLSGLTAGSVHYLDAATAGALTTTAPTIAVPIILADTTTSGVIVSRSAAKTNLPTSSASYSTLTASSGTHNFAASGEGDIFHVVAVGAGGGMDTSVEMGATSRYVASTSGGSPTIAINGNASGGGGGGGGAIGFWAYPYRAGVTSFTYTTGAAGTDGTTPTDGGSTAVTMNASTVTAYGGKKGANPTAGGGYVALPGMGGLGGGGDPVLGNVAFADFWISPGGNGGDGKSWTVLNTVASEAGSGGAPGFCLGDLTATSYGMGGGETTNPHAGVIYVFRYSI